MSKKTILFSILSILVLGLCFQAPIVVHAQEATEVNEDLLRRRQAEARERGEDIDDPREAPAPAPEEKTQIPANEAEGELDAEMAGGCMLQNGASSASLLQGLAFLLGSSLPLVSRRKKNR